MKKLLLFFAAILVAGSMWGTEVTYTTGHGKDIASNEGKVNTGNFSITLTETDSNTPNNWNNNTHVRVQAGNSFIVTPASGRKIEKIVLLATAADYMKTWSSTVGDVPSNNNEALTITWEGEATSAVSLTNTASAQARIKSITVTYSIISTTTYTVTFNAGTNGTCSTTSLTETSPNAGVTLPSCTPKEGYKFLGWTATQNGTTVDNGLTAGATYKPTEATTLYAVYGQLYLVTIESPVNGSLSVKCGDVVVSDGDKYTVGDILTIKAIPDDGYKVRNIQVVDNSTRTFTNLDNGDTKVWTMGEHAITIKANFDEIVYHTIVWSVNGSTIVIENSSVADGEIITFPENVDDILNKKFMGWSASSTASSASDLVSGEVAATADATYYAVFATVTATEETIFSDDFNISGTDQVKSRTGFSTLNSIYANNGCIRLSTSNTGVGKLVKTKMSAMSSTATIRFKLKAWSASEHGKMTVTVQNGGTLSTPNTFDISDNENWTEYKLTLTDATTNTTITFTGVAKYRMQMKDLVITKAGDPIYSKYTTTIASSTSITISAAEYSTYYNSEFAYTMPENCEGFVFTAEKGLESAYDEGDVVPAGEPLVIYTIVPGTKTLVFTTSSEETYKSGDMNDLDGTDVATDLTQDADAANNYYYALSLNAAGETSSVGFYWMAEGGAAFTNGAHKAYLKLAKSLFEANHAAPRSFVFGQTDTATAVEDVEAAEEVVKFIENGQILIKKNGVVYNAMGQVIR